VPFKRNIKRIAEKFCKISSVLETNKKLSVSNEFVCQNPRLSGQQNF